MKPKHKHFRSFILLSALGLCISFSAVSPTKVSFYKDLKKYCSTLPGEFNQVPEERKKDLYEIGNYIIDQRTAHKKCALLFICTSNSRRSHMAQVWAQTASVYFGVDSIMTFSGGTEATRVHPNTIAALRRCGYSITTSQASENPDYFVNAGDEVSLGVIYSKKYNNSINPKRSFLAAMVCSEADKSCPSVEGADLRIGMPYDDPKYYDNTPSQDQKYDERCRQIAREMFFIMDYVKQKLILKIESTK